MNPFQHGKGAKLPYRVKPAPVAGRSPVLVFLHGVGERGDDNSKQLSYPFFANDDSLFGQGTLEAYPCHVLAPQVATSDVWVKVPNWTVSKVVLEPEPTAALQAVVELIETYGKRPDVDADRIYIVGLSIGGVGVYELLARRSSLFAAGVAICGAGDLTQVERFKSVPLTIAHGALDQAVSVHRSREMVKALTAVGGMPVYKEYPNQGHDVWNTCLADSDLAPWLFAQVRRT